MKMDKAFVDKGEEDCMMYIRRAYFSEMESFRDEFTGKHKDIRPEIMFSIRDKIFRDRAETCNRDDGELVPHLKKKPKIPAVTSPLPLSSPFNLNASVNSTGTMIPIQASVALVPLALFH